MDSIATKRTRRIARRCHDGWTRSRDGSAGLKSESEAFIPTMPLHFNTFQYHERVRCQSVVSIMLQVTLAVRHPAPSVGLPCLAPSLVSPDAVVHRNLKTLSDGIAVRLCGFVGFTLY